MHECISTSNMEYFVSLIDAWRVFVEGGVIRIQTDMGFVYWVYDAKRACFEFMEAIQS